MNRSASRSLTPEKHSKSQATTEPKSPNKLIPADKVKIYVRLRPSLNEEEWNNNLVICDENNIKIIKSDLDMTYMKFDKIFTSKLQQNNIFQSLDHPIQRFLEGENHSFFAYGQTGAGKTYTMIGDFQETNPFASKQFLTSEHKGILPRALEKVIEYIRTQNHKCTLLGSFYEVYNEKIYDLLNPRTATKREGLELRECKDGTNKIQDLLKIDIKNVDDALQCLRVGLKNRVTGCSHANTKSSRSHSIFQLVLIQEDKDNPKIKKTSKLRIVDLAGSEKFKIPKTLDAEERELHILELTSINGSLSALGHCITALTDPKRTHIPFRNSKLTRVLSDSLIGDSKITFIVCLSPSMESAQESFSTLQFASRAKKIILDGRHIKKKEEAIQKNLKVLNKSNNVLELFKQLCSDKTVMSSMMDPAMQSKISLLEREIRDLKMKNQRLQSQVTELKRSYTPETSPYKKSSENLLREDSKQSRSTNVSPSRGDFRRQASPQDLKRSKQNKSSKSVTRIPSEKKVRFTEDCFTEKVKHEMEYQDNTIFENLSIFREMQEDTKKKQLSMEEIKKMKEQRANYLKFWSDADNEDNNRTPSHNQSEENSRILDFISVKGQAKTNLFAQKIREKEIEKKYEQFFSLDTKPQQQAQSNNDDLSASLQGIPKPSGPNNSFASVQIQNGFFGQEDDSRRCSRDVPALVYRPKINEYNEENQPLFSEPHELSLIDQNQNHTIVELTEENFVTDRMPQEFTRIKEEVNVNRRLENEYSPLTENQDYNYESGRSESASRRDYNSNGLDIIREFDKKLMSVHQLNEQHQELIKNIGIKFAGWQDSDRQLKDKNVYSTKSTINTSNSGRDVNQVVKDIKQELSEALNQIQELKLTDYNTCSTTILTQEARSQQSLGDDKSSNPSYKSLDRYNWDEGRLREGNNAAGFQSKGKESKNSVTQGGSRAINDIIGKHWSMYKENVK